MALYKNPPPQPRVSIIGFTLFFIPEEALFFFPPTSTRTVQYIYQLIANISAACMACHLTGSQIPLQADWLWLCSLQASVHIYTVTYRVTCRFSGIGGRIMGNYFLRIYAKTTNMAKMMITIMCTGNYLFNSIMVFLASPLLRKYPIIFDITDDTDLSSSSAMSFRKSSLSLVVLNDKKESFFIVKSYNIV